MRQVLERVFRFFLQAITLVLEFITVALPYILTAIGVLAGAYILWMIGNFFFIKFVWGGVVGTIVGATGMNIWLARSVAVLGTALIFWLFTSIFLSFGRKTKIFSIKIRRKKLGWIVLSAATIFVSLAMYVLTQDQFFSFATGKATMYYVVAPDGTYRFSQSQGYDQFTGDLYQPVTPEIVKKHLAIQSVMESGDPKISRYFDSKTGQAVKWYVVAPDSSIRVFHHPGFDSLSGDELKPITPEIVRQVEQDPLLTSYRTLKKLRLRSGSVISMAEATEIASAVEDVFSQVGQRMGFCRTRGHPFIFLDEEQKFFDQITFLCEQTHADAFVCRMLRRCYLWDAHCVKVSVKNNSPNGDQHGEDFVVGGREWRFWTSKDTMRLLQSLNDPPTADVRASLVRIYAGSSDRELRLEAQRKLAGKTVAAKAP